MALRFGLFGTGRWADEVHAAALVAEPSVDLVGVWGRNPDKARTVAGHWDVRRTTTSTSSSMTSTRQRPLCHRRTGGHPNTLTHGNAAEPGHR